MQLYIYLTFAFVAISAAKQLNMGPQVLSEPQYVSSSSPNPEKRYIPQEYTLYLTPDDIKALQVIKSSETVENAQIPKERQSEQQNEDKQQIKWYNKQVLPQAPQLAIQGLAAHDAFSQKQQAEAEVQQGNYKLIRYYAEEKPKEQIKETQTSPELSKENLESYYNWQNEQNKTQLEIDSQNDSKWEPNYTVSAKNQDNIQLNDQLKQQWYRILDHNRVQLKSVSPVSRETQQLKSSEKQSKENLQSYFDWQNEQQGKTQQETDTQNDAIRKPNYTVSAKNQDDVRLNEQLKEQWNRILDHNRVQLKSVSSAPKESQALKSSEKPTGQWKSKNEVRKEIENILREHRGYEFAKQSGTNQAAAINQGLPILIHKEVSVTKHLPVPFIKKVKVSVPTPVLIPVPEPYEVKIPHPYPVPQQIFKHIPLPIIRNY